jgi:hypothetical protein
VHVCMVSLIMLSAAAAQFYIVTSNVRMTRTWPEGVWTECGRPMVTTKNGSHGRRCPVRDFQRSGRAKLSSGRSATVNKVALVLLPWHVAAVVRPQSLLRQGHCEFSTVRYSAASFNFQYPAFLFKVIQ